MNNVKDIVILHKIKLLSYRDNSSQKKDNKLFGLWSDKDFDVEDYIRNLRKKFKMKLI
jgi:hypothetical protein